MCWKSMHSPCKDPVVQASWYWRRKWMLVCLKERCRGSVLVAKQEFGLCSSGKAGSTVAVYWWISGCDVPSKDASDSWLSKRCCCAGRGWINEVAGRSGIIKVGELVLAVVQLVFHRQKCQFVQWKLSVAIGLEIIVLWFVVLQL